MADQDFLAIARSDLDALEAKLKRLDQDVAAMEDQRRVAREQIEQVRAALSYYVRVMGSTNGASKPVKEGADGAWGYLAPLTIAQACEEVMRLHSGFARTVFLVSVLREAGKLPNPKTAYGAVVRELQRHPQMFQQLAKGQWALISRGQVDQAGPASFWASPSDTPTTRAVG
jgi:hypothetical protein